MRRASSASATTPHASPGRQAEFALTEELSLSVLLEKTEDRVTGNFSEPIES